MLVMSPSCAQHPIRYMLGFIVVNSNSLKLVRRNKAAL
jgi:hypothetical protein